MKRPKQTDKECKRQGMMDVPVANYSKMQDKYIDFLEKKNIEQLKLCGVGGSLPTNKEIGLRIEEIVKLRYPKIEASLKDQIDAEVLKQGFLECKIN